MRQAVELRHESSIRFHQRTEPALHRRDRVRSASRILYSTDASIYQIEPRGVAVPKTQDDLQAAVELAAKYKIPILPRGAGTGLAGQAIGDALILDCSAGWIRLYRLTLRQGRQPSSRVLSSLN